ncbi:Lrp/AsnC family transcriptional regulator [archaeon]|jgi:Lrp/AsnC family transcriptional regulator, leucine-responsive regulatory protein|nr:Lrp/AsnC family transcriptional regulator [archaeon]MBT6698678.1 Lrp/AsnC family transcriptional regulator [archaeon]
MALDVKIDLKDRRILYELCLNARASSSFIAKKVGLSSQLVDYRMKRLEKLDVIQGYYSCIDISKVGYSIFKIYIRLQNLSKEEEEKMINDLSQSPQITWVAQCDGAWDLYLVVWAKNVFSFNETFKEINNKYSYYFSKKSIIANTTISQFTRKHLAPEIKMRDYSKLDWLGEISEVELDKVDYQILLTISLNARFSEVEIAKRIGSSLKTVRYRLKKLITQKIIFAYRPFLNGDLLGYKNYKVFLSIQSLTPEREKKLISYLNTHPYVIEVIHCIGNWEIELEIETPSIESKQDLIRDLRDKFTDVIREIQTMLIYKSSKYDYLPSGLKEIQEKLKD